MRYIKRVLIPALFVILLLGSDCRARRLYAGDPRGWKPFADAVAGWAESQAGTPARSPGGPLFDAEWTYGTCAMAVVGLSQVVLENPEMKERYSPAIETCLDWLVSEGSREFGTRMWSYDGLKGARGSPEHAYLGYLGLALGVHRLVEPEDRFARIHDRLAASFANGMHQPPYHFETYPGQAYPCDQSTVAATVALQARATGRPSPAVLNSWLEEYRSESVDPQTGLLFQAISPHSGRPKDDGRGSGTALAAFALSYADPRLSSDLFEALSHGYRSALGLGAMREYAPAARGRGDIDSGPVLFGLGVSATGFAIAGARIHQDERKFLGMSRLALLVGAPIPRHGGTWLATGGAIGNAIMLAMWTAPVASPTVAVR